MDYIISYDSALLEYNIYTILSGYDARMRRGSYMNWKSFRTSDDGSSLSLADISTALLQETSLSQGFNIRTCQPDGSAQVV